MQLTALSIVLLTASVISTPLVLYFNNFHNSRILYLIQKTRLYKFGTVAPDDSCNFADPVCCSGKHGFAHTVENFFNHKTCRNYFNSGIYVKPS